MTALSRCHALRSVAAAEVRVMSGDEPQTGVRGGVTQITPTDGQRGGSWWWEGVGV